MVRFAAIALMLATGMPYHAWAQTLQAKVNKSTVSVGERFQLSFVLNDNGSNFTPPDLSDFQVLGGPNQSSNMQWINGNFSSSISFSYYLRAVKEGDFEIGPASIKVKGKTITSDPITVKVVKGGSRSPHISSGNKTPHSGDQPQGTSLEDQINANLFMKLFVDKKRAYVGEQIVATYKLYINVQVVDHNIRELPVFNGFYAQNVEIPNGSEISEEIVNGKRFSVATVKRVILFPQQSGELEVPEFNMNLVVRVNEQRKSRSLFDQFFGTYRNVKVAVKSNKEKIVVEPLPRQGQPSDFTGAVGNYKLTAKVDKKELTVNDAINLDVTISGSGNLELITDPGIGFPADFETYDPKVKENIDATPGGVSGQKTFEYVLIPRYVGSYSLEPIAFSYFNPETRTYERTETPSIHLEVKKGSGEAADAQAYTAPRKEDVQVLGRDIRFIKTGEPELRSKGSNFFGSPAFIALSVAPFAGMGMAIMLLSFLRVRQADVAGMRKRNAKTLAKRKLSKARKLAGTEGNAFFDEVYKALYGYLADRLLLQQTELSKERITEVLQEHGISEQVIDELKHCLDDCEMVRFAPGAVRSKQEVLNAAEQVIGELEHELA